MPSQFAKCVLYNQALVLNKSHSILPKIMSHWGRGYDKKFLNPSPTGNSYHNFSKKLFPQPHIFVLIAKVGEP